ncbi:hypothetical protein MRI28_17125 [Nocardiopsis dassonvillei]|uniref:hypothetical protein n=1 Tax=Nocardiopsis dassonvillei TaxID=2014 RepID=UPI0020100F1F|nr:hypothetical protein [Nocardiopsis dassonvillei]MCK9871338.1 hypothetical protein [Nocardiopsis dassonvillei]
MEFTTFSIESCAPAADGGVVPGLVPIPNVDPDAVEEAAAALRTAGEAIEGAGAEITSTWASLTGIYVAPEADTLLAALDPVPADGTDVATASADAASALETFAETARELKARLKGLKADVEAFRAEVGWDDEWLEDEDHRERNNNLNDRIAEAVHEFQEAERECANKIGAHYGGTFFTGHSDKANHDQTSTSGDRPWQVYGTATAPTGQANPWGSSVDAPTSHLEDALWGLGDLVVGAVIGLGVGTGLYRDGQFAYPFGTEHGQNLQANWVEAQESFWALAGSDAHGAWQDPGSADAQYHNARGPWMELGDSIVPVSEWEDRPAYTIVTGAGNVALMASPIGLARTVLDAPDLGHGTGAGTDGDFAVTDRGLNNGGTQGLGFTGTDTVGMSAGSPTSDLPDPGTGLGAMNESLADLQSHIENTPAPTPEAPATAPERAPSPEASTGFSPDTPGHSGEASSTAAGDAPTTTPETPTGHGGEEAGSPRQESDPTAHELREGTARTDADQSSEPWTAAPTNDGTAPRQESPTHPVHDPADIAPATSEGSGSSDRSTTEQTGDGADEGASLEESTASGDTAAPASPEGAPTPDASGGGSGSGADVPGAGGGGADGTGGDPDDSFYFSEGDRDADAGFTTLRDDGGNLGPADSELYQQTEQQLAQVGLNKDDQRQILAMLQKNPSQEGQNVARIIASGVLNDAPGYGSFLTKFSTSGDTLFSGAAAELRFAYDLANRPGTEGRNMSFPESGRSNDDVDTMLTGDSREDHFSYQVKSIESVGSLRKHVPKIIGQLSGETANGTTKVAIIEINASVADFHQHPRLKNIIKFNADEHAVGFRLFFRDGVVTIPPDAPIYP